VARHSARADAGPERDDVAGGLAPPVPPDVRRSARLVQLLVVALLLIAAGVVGALGGFARAPATDKVPAAAIDQPVEAGAWRVTIHSAAAGTELHGNKADPGTYLIEVEATVLVTDNRSRKPYDAVTLDGITTIPDLAPDLTFVRDNRLASDLQPGLPERIAFGWAVTADTPLPKELRVTVVREVERRTGFFFLGDTGLPQQNPAAIVTVAVTDKRATP
jgi:hypothetical protein